MDLINLYIGFVIFILVPIVIGLVLRYDWEIGKEKK